MRGKRGDFWETLANRIDKTAPQEPAPTDRQCPISTPSRNHGGTPGVNICEAAFATLAGLYRVEARDKIAGITLLAGIASTFTWPATAALTDKVGWRRACVVLAALNLVGQAG
jgi:hypothetical protein